jgi:hypothetical protein
VRITFNTLESILNIRINSMLIIEKLLEVLSDVWSELLDRLTGKDRQPEMRPIPVEKD